MIFRPDYCDHKANPSGCVARLTSALQSMGVSWFYTWWYDEAAFDWLGSSVKFSPMVWGPGYENPDQSYSDNELNQFASMAKKHPGSTWLIWNEPDNPGQANIPIPVAVQIYPALRQKIMSADPTAKMVIGGSWTSWAQQFTAQYQAKHGERPACEGWHGHLYVNADGSGGYTKYDPTAWRQSVMQFRQFIDSNGGGELWLTEYGDLTEELPAIISDQLSWMEKYDGIQRYAWFAAGDAGQYTGNLFKSTPDMVDFGLSILGQTYAQYP